MRNLVLLTTIALLGISVGHTAPSADWAINATAIEACSCPHFCICYFNSHPAAHHDQGKMEHYCKFNNAYKVNEGHYGETSLTGAKFWITGDLGADFSQGQMKWALVTFDKGTSPQQRQALGEILGHVFPVKWQTFNTGEGNIDWTAVLGRYEDALKVAPPRPLYQKEFADVPAITPEEVKAMFDSGEGVQVIDARPRHYTTKSSEIMDGAVWRDPERLDDWIGELSKEKPVVTYCVYGFHIGCQTAIALRKQGYDARYMAGGHYAWKAIGGKVKLLEQ